MNAREFFNRGKSVLAVIGLVAVLVLALAMFLTGSAQAIGGGDPGTGSNVNYRTVTFADGAAEISATKYYSPSGHTTLGYLAQDWYMFDLFVTADVSGTNTITVTPQWSADGTNWVSAKYESEGWVLPLTYNATLTNSSGVTNTTTSTSTYSFSGSTGSRQSEWVTYQLAISSDTSDYMPVPMHGNYIRFKAELLSTGAGTAVTPTIKVVFRNNAGR